MILLCIDDDPEDIELFQDAVREIDEECTLVVASNGYDGLQMLKTLIPDYIFLDINMPIMDGKETLRNIRMDQRFHSIPVCILSTTVTKKDKELCMNLGANICMVKANSFRKFISDLREVIEGEKLV